MRFVSAAFVALCFALSFTSCTKKSDGGAPQAAAQTASSDPESVVRRFIELSAGAKSLEDKDRLMKLCSGEMRRAFERMPDETFQLSYLGNKIKIRELTLVDSARREGGARIRYRIAVENAGGSDTTQEKTEREVDLKLVENSWLIENIRLRDTDRILFVNGMLF